MMEWAFSDRSDWKSGPWDLEPIDKKVWKDSKTGLDCMIHRNPMGAWCGYVGVPSGHKLFGKDCFDDLTYEFFCHGGLTFSESCHGMNEDGSGICHPADDGDHVWWFGFDCSHLDDLTPIGSVYGKAEYRTQAYVEKEVANLAAQLAA